MRWLLFLCAIFSSVLGHSETATIKLTIVDRANGEPVAARLHVRDASGAFAIADDAVMFGGDCDMSDAGAGFTTLEAAIKGFTESLSNPYFGTIQFYADGVATVAVAAGTSEIAVFKGPEYRVARFSLDAVAGSTVEHTVKLDRWIDMPAKGWYSADDHLHIQRPHPDLNPRIMKQMQAEDIHVANLLQMGKVLNFKIAPQYEFGQRGHYQEGHYILAAGQENPRTHYLGHTITLGAPEPVFDRDEYLIYRKIWEQTSRLGGLNGFAHAFATSGGVSPYAGGAVILPHDLLHFLEVLQFNRGGYDFWYDVLNLGFKVAATAGTDYPCADQTIPGHERFYTKVEGELTFARWLDGVKDGRTFVTTGPVLEFDIDGRGIGGEVALTGPGKIRVRGSVTFNPAADGLGVLELIRNGNLVTQVANVEGRDRIDLDVELHVEETSWFALRSYGTELSSSGFSPPFHFSMLGATSNAHTSPIYVSVDGTESLRESAQAKAVARAFLARLASLEGTLVEGNLQMLGGQLEVP
ncbi:MAG: CehA/McbA family metallohydrolase, partial [Gammaproteobacteria bacterium]|nr:CehA/McbA family metallohydrolase [Gammaproteobacteria bacterium]